MYLSHFSSFSPNTDEANEKLEKVFEDLVQEQRLGKKKHMPPLELHSYCTMYMYMYMKGRCKYVGSDGWLFNIKLCWCIVDGC